MALGLLAPLNLLAGLAVAVPVAIHLLQRKREATVDFPAVRFLLIAQRRSSRRLRLRRRGLCILISDLLDDPRGLEQGLRHLHHRRHDLMVLHLADRDELELPFRKLTLFRDPEGGPELTTDPREIRREYRAAMDEHLTAVRALCRRNGADYDFFVTDQSLERGLVRYLARREG